MSSRTPEALLGAQKRTKGPDVTGVDARFLRVVKTFAKDRDVSQRNKKGFGSGALEVRVKIFAMVSSKGYFVVKLPKKRVDELVNSGQGKPFDPGHGRVMKEWVVVEASGTDWFELARQAYEFVKRRKQTSP